MLPGLLFVICIFSWQLADGTLDRFHAILQFVDHPSQCFDRLRRTSSVLQERSQSTPQYGFKQFNRPELREATSWVDRWVPLSIGMRRSERGGESGFLEFDERRVSGGRRDPPPFYL